MLGLIPDLAFDNGWLYRPFNNSPRVSTEHHTERLWVGMHRYIHKHFDNKLQGTITHYDALPSAQRTVKGFCRNKKGASTHFIISRDGVIYQIASIYNRTWHAGFRKDEWPGTNGRFEMVNGHTTGNPNHWFVGIDLSNWGLLEKKGPRYYSWADVEIGVDSVEKAGKRYWEKYTDEALISYAALQVALVNELSINREMHYRHSDTSPTRKIDPGDAFPFDSLLDDIYKEVTLEFIWPANAPCRQGDMDAI